MKLQGAVTDYDKVIVTPNRLEKINRIKI